MTRPAADPTQSALHRLEAERLRPSRDETPADPWMDLIAALDRLLSDPPPPDPRPEEAPVAAPVLSGTSSGTDTTEETPDHG